MIDTEVLCAPGAFDGDPRPVPVTEDVAALCSLTAASAGIEEGHLAIEFVDARRIAELNEQYRGKAAPTDVLSFPIDGVQPIGQLPDRELGDVIICPAHTTDLREAIVHGVLHLLGFDHETDDGEMLRRQRELLDRLQA